DNEDQPHDDQDDSFHGYSPCYALPAASVRAARRVRAGCPATRRTAPATARPQAAPPTTSSGRCAPTYIRAKATRTTAVTAAIRPQRGRYGQLIAVRAVTTATWPETKPCPAAGAPRMWTFGINEAGRPRITRRRTTSAAMK